METNLGQRAPPRKTANARFRRETTRLAHPREPGGIKLVAAEKWIPALLFFMPRRLGLGGRPEGDALGWERQLS
jgi:hypothetical protein